MIDFTKPVQTKKRKEHVRILTTTSSSSQEYPVIGEFDDGRLCRFRSDGTYPWSAHDLENVPKPHIKRDVWMNVYHNYTSSSPTKHDADCAAGYSRLACIKVTIDCEEGEGLDPR